MPVTKGIIGYGRRHHSYHKKQEKGPAPLKEITYLSVKVGGAVKFKEDIMTIEELYDKWENGTEEEKQEVEREILGRLLYYNGD